MAEKSIDKSKIAGDSKESAPKYETLVIHGVEYLTLLTKKYINRKKWAPKNEKHILSYIPGTILKVLVKDGEKVEKDQPLIVLEAMKMENTIFAPHTGVLKKVNIKNNDKVPKGLIMIEYK
jgi:biotin carboxyl carrier protein